MVDIERQFEIAVELAHYPNAVVILLCLHSHANMYFMKAVEGKHGTLNETYMEWKSDNGGVLRVFSTDSRNLQRELGGLQATHILIHGAMYYTDADIDFLTTRLRSSKYKGVLELYMPEGFVASFRSYG